MKPLSLPCVPWPLCTSCFGIWFDFSIFLFMEVAISHGTLQTFSRKSSKWCQKLFRIAICGHGIITFKTWQELPLLSFSTPSPICCWNASGFRGRGSYMIRMVYISAPVNPFHAIGFFLYTLKISENLWFSDVFRCIDRDQWHKMGYCNTELHLICKFSRCSSLTSIATKFNLIPANIGKWKISLIKSLVQPLAC